MPHFEVSFENAIFPSPSALSHMQLLSWNLIFTWMMEKVSRGCWMAPINLHSTHCWELTLLLMLLRLPTCLWSLLQFIPMRNWWSFFSAVLLVYVFLPMKKINVRPNRQAAAWIVSSKFVPKGVLWLLMNVGGLIPVVLYKLIQHCCVDSKGLGRAPAWAKWTKKWLSLVMCENLFGEVYMILEHSDHWRNKTFEVDLLQYKKQTIR